MKNTKELTRCLPVLFAPSLLLIIIQLLASRVYVVIKCTVPQGHILTRAKNSKHGIQEEKSTGVFCPLDLRCILYPKAVCSLYFRDWPRNRRLMIMSTQGVGPLSLSQSPLQPGLAKFFFFCKQQCAVSSRPKEGEA
ncbi:hypothetical protein BX600DRAFT_231771 [Xylariales sp. PMI_506]|nr:hypothetical protein BX600DRAFT_231771 [Xylariales sp. PMI_506]